MKFKVTVVAQPVDDDGKAPRYLLAQKELNTDLGDELIAAFEDIYLPMEKNLLLVSRKLSAG